MHNRNIISAVFVRTQNLSKILYSHLKLNVMELTNANNENPFDPTPKLKSSPIQIEFIPFDSYDDYTYHQCNYCGEEYSEIILKQKY